MLEFVDTGHTPTSLKGIPLAVRCFRPRIEIERVKIVNTE